MMFLKDIFLVGLVFTIVNGEVTTYEGYKVYKIVPQNDNEVQVIVDLQKKWEYSFWSDIVAVDGDVRVMVGPKLQDDFESYLSTVGISPVVVIEDVQEQIYFQMRRLSELTRNSNEYAWDYYQTLEEINEWMNEIVQEHSDVATLVEIGASVEGRNIYGVKIDFKKQDNPTIGMIEGGIHAREWISPATVTWIIKEFLTSTDPSVRFVAENVVWHIFPVVNPDGYAYTFTNNRMWRKNRSRDNNGTCAPWNLSDDMSNGIDLNRNFGFMWMTTGASSNPCAETFAGPTQFSEPEAIAIANYVILLQSQGNLVFYYAFHSYSQMVLVPFSHVGGSDVLEAPNYGDMFEIAIRGMAKLMDRHGTWYLVGTSADILYEVSGSSIDWAKGGANVPIVYLFELRDLGQYGFLLPPEQIVPNNVEIMTGLVEMDRVSRSLNYYTASASRVTTSVFAFLLAILFLVRPLSAW